MPKIKFFLSGLLGLSAFLSTGTSSSATDPATDWKVLETDHFEIIHDAAQSDLAHRYALYAETAFHDLTPVFREFPKKTVVWLNNTTDIANGMATAFPYPMIVVFPVIPGTSQSVGEYGNWGQELVTHEYTHILQFEPQHGIMGFLRWIFGSIVVPNGVLPRWWLEGMAVETESQWSAGGRLRSVSQQAALRALSLGDGLAKEDISRINETSIPDWLGGGRPYLFGSLMWKELVDWKGNKSLYELNQRYSRRIPFFINPPVRDLTEKDYQEILDAIYAKIRANTQTQLAQIHAAGKMRVLPQRKTSDTTQSWPLISPDGDKLAYIESQPETGTQLALKIRNNPKSFRFKKARAYPQVRPASRLSWSPDSNSLFFDRIDTYDRFYNFSDIHRFDLETRKVTAVTKGLRAREPAVSPDGKTVVFVKIDGEQMHLAQTDTAGENYKLLYSPPIGHRVSHPEFYSPEKLVFTERDMHAKELMKTLRLADRSVQTVLSDYQPAYRPQRTPAGLLFISDRSGASNVYLAKKDFSSVLTVSNAETGIDSATWDSRASELVYAYMSPEGPAIGFTPQPKGKIKTHKPPKLGLTLPYDRPPYTPPNVTVSPVEKDYSPWKYLIPRYWMPYFALSTDGLFLQASTSAFDPLSKHSYSLLGAFDTGTEKFNWAASYTNQSTRIPVTLAASDIYDFFGGSDLVRRETSYMLSLASYIWGLSERWGWNLLWEYQDTALEDVSSVRQGPGLAIRYTNIGKQGRQLVPESGGDALLSATYFIEELGDVGFFRTQMNASYYFSGWLLPKRHVFSSKLRGVYAPDNNLLLTGVSTSAGSYENTLITNQLLMRGYLSGNFIGKNVVNASFEYIFPLKYSYSGWGTTPLFSRHWHGRLVADIITQDGVYFDQDANRFRGSDLGEFFSGGGGELHWQTTVGYHLPLRIFLGLYYGFNREAAGGFQSFLGMGL